jgi:LPS export ABC transporter protein LptC
MKTWRLLVLLGLLALAVVALWIGRREQDRQASPQQAEAPQVAYDYEAHDVVVRQMGPDGRLEFQVQARQITQMPASGRIEAQGLTLYHDPPGTEPGGPNRWTLTADSGELPAEGGVVTLAGHVRARGVPLGGGGAVTFATEHLQYDLATQELGSDDDVQVTWGANTTRIRGLRFNIRTGEGLGSEINAILDPR